MIGEVVASRYRVIARIGAGGGGDVFEAEDLELPRLVAIKFLSPMWTDQQHLRQRFLREAEALSALDHPHICTIYEAGETESGRLFIAMAYYPGQDLRARLAHGALDIVEAVSWGVSIADGMDKAHRKGFLHRDLKPGNIIITEDGVVKILDFGLAKLPDRTQMTETGATMGTLAYSAPEQARGENADARSDIYSLGVVLYQMVTGVCPFAASGAAATLQMVFESAVTPPRKIRSGLPRRLDTLIRRCMDRDPANRPQSMDEVRTDLLDILASIAPSEAALQRAQHVDTTSTPDAPAGHPVRRWLAVAAAVLIVGVAAWKAEAIRDLILGPEETVNRGAVVIPFRTEGDEEALQRIGAGLWADLVDEAMRLADLSPRLWVLPARVAIDSDIDTAVDAFGVERMITGAVSIGDGHYNLELTTITADGQTLASGSWPLPSSGPVAPDLLSWLADALDVRLPDARRDEVARGSPEQWDTLESYLTGLGALQLGDHSAAVTHLRTASELEPGFVPARLRYAEAMINFGAEDGGEIWLDRADSLLAEEPRPLAYPGTTYALMSLAAKTRRDLTAAARLMKLALEHRPANPAFRRALWLLWVLQGDADAADAITRVGIDLNPGYYGAYEDQAYVSYYGSRLDEAIEFYEKTIALAPGNANAMNSVGACYLMLERWEEATESFERSFAIKASGKASSNLGTLYYMRGDFELAADMLELAAHYAPNDHVVVGNRASALRWIPGREDEFRTTLDEAVALAEAALADDPQDPNTLAYLAGYLTESDPERSIALADRCLAFEPDDPEVLYRVAVTFEEIGERTRALAVLETALAHGMSMGQLTNEPLMKDLREDSRFRLLLP